MRRGTMSEREAQDRGLTDQYEGLANHHYTVDEWRAQRAARAVRVFNSQWLPKLKPLVQSVTGDKKLQVRGAAYSATDGKTLFVRVPIELGDEITHDRKLCGEYDVYGQPKCAGCKLSDEIIQATYHEVAHILEDSFAEVSEDAAKMALERALEERKARADGKVASRINAYLAKVRSAGNYMGAAQAVSPFLPTLVNAFEDARVNERLHERWPGTRRLFQQKYQRTLGDGWTDENGQHFVWSEQSPDAQASIAVLAMALGLDCEGWFSPEIDPLLNDPEIQELARRGAQAKSPEEAFGLAIETLTKIRKHGLLKAPDDLPQAEDDAMSPPPPSAPMPTADMDFGSDDDEVSDEQQADGDTSDKSEGDGSAESDSADSEDTGGNSDSEGDTDPDADGDSDGGDEAEGDSGGSPSEDDTDAQGDGAGEGTAGEDDEAESDTCAGDGEGDGDGDGGDQESDGGTGDSSGSETGADKGADAGESTGSDSEGDNGDGTDLNQSPGGGRNSLTEDYHKVDYDFGDEDDDDFSGEGEGDEDGDEESAGGDAGESSSSDGDGDSESETGAADDAEAQEKAREDAERRAREAAEAVRKFGGHQDDHSDANAPDVDRNALEQAVVQADHFDTHSVNIFGVYVHERFDQHGYRMPDGSWFNRTARLAWDPEDTFNFCYGSGYDERAGIDDFTINEAAIGSALARARIVFADNKRAKLERNLKRGPRLDARALGRRIPVDDYRIFAKRTIPAKKDYFVLLGLDNSGSTQGINLKLIKHAALHKAEMLHRLGVKFAIYAHNGCPHFWPMRGDSFDLDIVVIKSPDEPWGPEQKRKLKLLMPGGNNLDGHALEFYRKIVERRHETDKVLFYYTDGEMPFENYTEELAILQREIATLQRMRATLLGVGVNTDSPTRHGLKTVRISDVSDLSKIIGELEKQITDQD